MASRFRTIMDKICGLDERFEMLNERLTLIEQTIGINNFMSIGEGNVGNVGSGNVGVGSTVPPDVARYQELAAAQAAGSVGGGNVGGGNVGDGPPPVTAPDPTPAPDADGNVGDGQDGNVGDGQGNV